MAALTGLKALVGAKRAQIREDAEQREIITGKREIFVRRGELDRERDEKRRKQDEERREQHLFASSSEAVQGREDKGLIDHKTANNDVGNGNGISNGKENDRTEDMSLSADECKRMLRRFGQPATLFGETDVDRLERLNRVKREVKVVDDIKGGQQENEMRQIMEETEKIDKLSDERRKSKKYSGSKNVPENERDCLKEQFAAAAARLAKQIEVERDGDGPGPIICGYFQRLEEEWGEELGDRSNEVKKSVTGKQATAFYVETKKNLLILYDKITKGSLEQDVIKGLWMIVEAMKTRNYLNATDIYVRLAIGNAPWPIGVTSVGIHERSAREKISHAMNSQSAAHIMNDEGSRKWLQSVKRLLTFCQRRYPTDPSRCVNFNALRSEGFGKSDLSSLHQALNRGETTERLALPDAPHHHDRDGSIKPPLTWKAVLNNADRKMKEKQFQKSS